MFLPLKDCTVKTEKYPWSTIAPMNIGDEIRINACKADGSLYREWPALVESIEPNLIVTVAPVGTLIVSKGRRHKAAYRMRGYYWLDRFYNLFEIFRPVGGLVEIYLNIASPPEVSGDVISFKDHELDVSKVLPDKAKIVDEDEFAEAIGKYNYTKEFQEKMYAIAREGLEIADNWVAKPAPRFE